jgi:hypothetical protein
MNCMEIDVFEDEVGDDCWSIIGLCGGCSGDAVVAVTVTRGGLLVFVVLFDVDDVDEEEERLVGWPPPNGELASM